MPDFSHAPVKQNLDRACDDGCGAWSAVQDGQPELTATMNQMWWVYGKEASELRLDVSLSGAQVGDQIAFELWAQPQNVAGGGVKIFDGTLTVPNSAPPVDPRVQNATFFMLGAARGPFADGWGVRAQLVAPAGTGRRVRFKLVGRCTDSQLGTSVKGENVT